MNSTSISENPPGVGPLEGARAEFDALISACGVYNLSSRSRFAVTGSDRVRWLNGMVTNNVRDLAVGSGVYAFLLNPQGRILGDLYIYNLGESLVVDTDQSQAAKIHETFEKYIIMDDVEIATDATATVGISGPTALATLRKAGFDVPELNPLQFTPVPNHSGVTVQCGDNSSVESYELWVEPGNAQQIRDKLLNAEAVSTGSTALEWLRIACGIPRYGQDIRERDLPQETGQERALNFSKGCYIGQEIVERIRSRGNVHRMFSGFGVEGMLPEPGTKIQVDGKDAGEITSAASLPLGDSERGVALGYIRREIASAGKTFAAGASRLDIAKLPFAGFLRTEGIIHG